MTVTSWHSLTEAARLSGVTLHQARYWAEIRLVVPSVQANAGRGVTTRYGFEDLVALRTVARLRRDGLSLQRIRRGVAHLERFGNVAPLRLMQLKTDGRELYADGRRVLDQPGQGVLFPELQLRGTALDRSTGEDRHTAVR